MGNPYRTVNDAKTLEIEDTDRESHPFRMVVTLRKLNLVTKPDYSLADNEAEEIAATLTKAENQLR